MELAMQAARHGAGEAHEAVTRTWPASRAFVSRLVYTSCYAAAYGVVFPTVLLARSVPANNGAAQGLIDGYCGRARRSKSCVKKHPRMVDRAQCTGPHARD